jgi:hypothetical protein
MQYNRLHRRDILAPFCRRACRAFEERTTLLLARKDDQKLEF